MSIASGPLTVEEGRAMVARAHVCQRVERIALVVSGLAIPMFAVSIFELRRLEDAVAAGGTMGVPYFAYGTIFLFAAGMVTVLLMRFQVAGIHRALAAEQRRRWVERDAPVAGISDAAAPGAPQQDTPAAAG